MGALYYNLHTNTLKHTVKLIHVLYEDNRSTT